MPEGMTGSLFSNPRLFAILHNKPDFSVVLFRSTFMLFSEKNHVKALKNQWVSSRPWPSERLARATSRGHITAPEVQEAFAVL
jgi:hypothetical protein